MTHVLMYLGAGIVGAYLLFLVLTWHYAHLLREHPHMEPHLWDSLRSL